MKTLSTILLTAFCISSCTQSAETAANSAHSEINSVTDSTTSAVAEKTTEAVEATTKVANKASTAQSWEASYQSILDDYVTSSGVNYSKLKSNGTPTLLKVTGAVSTTKASGSKDDKLAYYLNAYNAWMLKKAIDAYPVSSLLETDSEIYKREDIVVGGKKMSLDYLENQIIRKEFPDARIHFALNCASGGCPPLHTKILTGDTLDTDLDALTSKFLNGPGVENAGPSLKVSKLFEWFKVDFTRDSPDGTVLGFIKKYNKNVSGTPSLSYLDYSWKLNEIK